MKEGGKEATLMVAGVLDRGEINDISGIDGGGGHDFLDDAVVSDIEAITIVNPEGNEGIKNGKDQQGAKDNKDKIASSIAEIYIGKKHSKKN